MFQDKTLVCQDCQQEFVFDASSQQFFSERGFTDPKRCKACARKRKSEREGGAPGGERQMFQTTCTQCGNAAEVPFQPTAGKPVLCRDCYRSKQDGPRG